MKPPPGTTIADLQRQFADRLDHAAGTPRSDWLPAWKLLAIVFIIAVALNYPWELAQSGLFAPRPGGANIWIHCFVASLGDGVLLLLPFASGWLAFKGRSWFVRPGLAGYVLLLIVGISVAIAVEWTAVHVLQRWSYAPAMPRLPGIEIGLVPILQMVLLPPLIFRLTAAAARRVAAARHVSSRPNRH